MSHPFEDEILSGIQDCSILLAFQSDHYASRPWCQMEILKAKELGIPILVIAAVAHGEPRSFPYLGNPQVVVWDSAKPRESTTRVLNLAARESLRYHWNRACLQRLLSDETTSLKQARVLATVPEALTLTTHPLPASGQQVFLYPDPPLGHAELQILKSLRDADYVTPLTLLARWPMTPAVTAVTVSVSESGDLKARGLCLWHEQTLTDEIHLGLLMAGLQIVYGGRLELSSGGQRRDFTIRLLDLARTYSGVACAAGTKFASILNVPPWPNSTTYNNAICQVLQPDAQLQEAPRPDLQEIPEFDEKGQPLFPAGVDLFKLPDTRLRRLARTRGLTLMRHKTTFQTQARIVIGGTLQGFSGLYPGVVEEAWWSVTAKRPLYLAGLFGGAAQAVIDLLPGRDRPEIANPLLGSQELTHETILQIARQRGLSVIDTGDLLPHTTLANGYVVHPRRIASDLRSAGSHGLAASLNNGLSDAQNHELFLCTEPERIVQLILTGLKNLV